MLRSLSGANATARLAARYIPKNSTRILVKADGVSCVYLYQTAGRLYAIGYRGTSARSEFHYSYRTEESRRQAVNQFIASVKATIDRRATARAERKAKPHTFKVGDIVNTSWGYDQTNVDFFVVTRISRACVWVRPVKGDYEATGFMSGKCWPAMPIEMTGPETRHVARGDYFSINGHSASLTKGERYCSSYA